MGLPASIDARHSLRVANLRIDDARFLLEGGRANATVYLAGYVVECPLKSLLLTVTPARRRSELLDSFRGASAHDLDRLRDRYRGKSGVHLPVEISRAFRRVSGWGTDLRYEARRLKIQEAEMFLMAVDVIHRWAESRA